MPTPDVCPNGCNLQGNPIPDKWREYYAPGTNYFSRAIGNYDWDKDATVSWSCPDCGITWPRENAPSFEDGKFLPGLVDLFERPSPFED